VYTVICWAQERDFQALHVSSFSHPFWSSMIYKALVNPKPCGHDFDFKLQAFVYNKVKESGNLDLLLETSIWSNRIY
jgi:hypothetical protein